MKDDLENHSKGQLYLLEQWLNIIRFQFEISQFGKKVLLGIILGNELISVRIWKGDILEDLEKLGVPYIYPRRINAKEVLITQKMVN